MLIKCVWSWKINARVLRSTYYLSLTPKSGNLQGIILFYLAPAMLFLAIVLAVVSGFFNLHSFADVLTSVSGSPPSSAEWCSIRKVTGDGLRYILCSPHTSPYTLPLKNKCIGEHHICPCLPVGMNGPTQGAIFFPLELVSEKRLVFFSLSSI